VILEVRDHGEGIPAELRDKVFERFYRADNSRNRETGGNGLGLAIVRALVEGHEGTIKAIETPGGGATFRVSLPA
jgi:two-component system OmpR family sensor kinase